MKELKKLMGQERVTVTLNGAQFQIYEIDFDKIPEIMECFSILKDLRTKPFAEIMAANKDISKKFISIASGIPIDGFKNAKLSEVLRVFDAVMDVNADSFFLIVGMIQKWNGMKSSNTSSKKVTTLVK